MLMFPIISLKWIHLKYFPNVTEQNFLIQLNFKYDAHDIRLTNFLIVYEEKTTLNIII